MEKLILHKYFGRSNCEEWSLNHFWHSGDSKAQEINYEVQFLCTGIAAHCLVSPSLFHPRLSVRLHIPHVLHPGTKRTGEKAGVKVRDREIQLGGKKMKREKNIKCS